MKKNYYLLLLCIHYCYLNLVSELPHSCDSILFRVESRVDCGIAQVSMASHSMENRTHYVSGEFDSVIRNGHNKNNDWLMTMLSLSTFDYIANVMK